MPTKFMRMMFLSVVSFASFIDSSSAASNEDLSAFTSLITRLAAPDAVLCSDKPTSIHIDAHGLYYDLFLTIQKDLLEKANAKPNDPNAIASELAKLKTIADKTIKSERGHSNFEYTVMPLGNTVAVSINYYDGGHFYFFGKPEVADPQKPWRSYITFDPAPIFGSEGVEFMPLIHGPSNIVRVLITTYWSAACVGPTSGVGYDIYEWQPAKDGVFKQLLNTDGEINLDGDDGEIGPPDYPEDKSLQNIFEKKGFGETSDGRVVLSHCERSAVETWDHASLCETAIYDLSGEKMRYIETRQNSPDLWALAGAINFAQKQERQALLGYVANAALADRLIHTDLPDAGEDFNIEKRQDGSEVITMGWGDIDPPPDVKYTMERRNGDWIITSFEILQSSAKDNSPTNQKLEYFK